MKKGFKIISAVLASLLVVLIIAIGILVWMVFTPEKLTPIVRKQANKYLTCQTEIGSVELTFFSTYPNFGLKINQLTLINAMKDAPNDTLVHLEDMTGIIDFGAWWKHDDIKIKEVLLNSGIITIFYDSLGRSNLDIFPPDSSAGSDSEPFNAEFNHIRFKDVNLLYADQTMPMTANIQHFTGSMNGKLQSDILYSQLKIEKSIVSLNYDGEQYLQNVNTGLAINFEYWLSYLRMEINEASGKLNELPINVSGNLFEDTSTQDLVFNLAFKLSSSPIEKIVPMVPPSYQSYFEGVSVTGMLALDGTMKGIMNETSMPLFNLQMEMSKGNLNYDGIPLAFHDIKGNITMVTDAMTDSLTFMKIDHLEANTAGSSFKLSGEVDHLFSDISCKLNTEAKLTLDEFNVMVPDEMKMTVKGKAEGQIKSTFTLTQLEKMQFDKIKISGAVSLSQFDAKYDTLWVTSDRTNMQFALPNTKSQSAETGFMTANISADNLKAGTSNGYSAYLGKSNIAFETSNVMDSTRIPNLICSFKIDSLAGSMDTILLAIAKPDGKLLLSPREGYPEQPQMQVTFSSGSMRAQMGKDLVSTKQLQLDANVINDTAQKDIFLQWLVKGFINMDQGHIAMSSLAYPLEIPSIKMDFDPENFNIKESNLIIDKSDFQLSGNLQNVLSYFRGDSILRGNFKFTSNNTDVTQLMALTSGIGDEAAKKDSTLADTTSTGPYMVPKGMDISLSTNIKKASFGTGTASNIKGDVLIHDGILVLDELRLTTPATRIQMTVLYRTPRKNHLYLGIDYHMLNIEIDELLKMVPEIDSLMPMLRSFSGKGEFHMAAETYLDSLYNLKTSTLRGAASITGQDLVLMDGETFSEIAKTLNFKKKTENKVDSLSAEFTVFKNEIDVYPFLIVMDKYKAVVSGRHNLDMSFDYHISVVDSPLPIKLGIDVKGKIDDLSYRLAKCRYADYYRPVSRQTVANKQLELRKMIRQSLIEKVTTDEN
ncbi:MAG: AsmA-like C-terminal region-containing protein [Prolixibacteraceae bacterium]